jgi:DDE superfamily endonuclease
MLWTAPPGARKPASTAGRVVPGRRPRRRPVFCFSEVRVEGTSRSAPNGWTYLRPSRVYGRVRRAGGNGCGGLSNPNNRHLTLRKKNSHSVGVAAQYASALGKTANCQTLVSLTLARGEVPVMLALRLFLPESWTSNRSWLDRAGVPAWPLDRVAQIADRKYCRPHARPFRLGFPRKVPMFPICPPAAL